MKLFAVTSVIVYTVDGKHKVEKIISKYGASVTEYLDLTIKDSHHYSFLMKIVYESQRIGKFIEDLSEVVPYINDESFGFLFSYEEEDYHHSPLFSIQSIGNNAQLYLKTKNVALKEFCSACKRKCLVEDQQIFIDVNKLVKNPLLFVNNYMVISERLAGQLVELDLTGYKLIEVSHKGRSEAKTRGYQIMPTNVLPKQCIPGDFLLDPYIINQDQRCKICKLGGHRFPPYYYNPKDLEDIGDFAFTYEYHNSDFVYRNILVSKQVFDFFKKNDYFVNEVRNKYTWEEKDWVLDPVLFNSDC